ncbi:Putative 12-oxophytodienoate reductase [Aspergillus calidoustus]|uniref:Putative 12-oxophytodienoate reductase n=1 Tax=Aspergillus calidoustus TaxID=454130 RepID=A0A0U5CJM4_ASPCI|nr:Putative 12-oxophytodienoate reductase [Aspergillus calidoustus]
MESPLAAKYFSQRTTPGSLIISQATGVGAEWAAWPWAAGLDTPEQQQALSRTIRAVHEKSGYWFQQLFHVGRCTSPALVKLARDRAGLPNPPPYSYRGVSASAVAESGINTHSGEPFGEPHPLTVEEIHRIRDDYKRTAQSSVDAGADGIEDLAGNGFLLDQFLHDNINQRTDEYGGSVENRSRFVLEVVDAVAEVVGYQRIGVRVSPFSNFHETDGSQPLEQILHLSRHLALRGIAYLHVGEARVSRNLDVEANLKRLLDKGIEQDDLSLRPFRRLLRETLPENPTLTPTVLVGTGGYTAVTGILTVEQDLADAVSFGRRFISNPDLVERLRFGYPLTPYDRSTFYTHGAEGYTTYPTYRSTQVGISEATDISASASERKKKRVAIIGAGISGIVSAAALQRVGGFDIQLYER